MSKRIIERKRPRCLMLEVSAEEDEVDEEEDDELLDVYLESEFMHEGSLYRVSRITANEICRRLWQGNAGKSINFEIGHPLTEFTKLEFSNIFQLNGIFQ
eukprot:scaffold180080_cov69-Attheya_sp.AAC.2